jgi:hypothetical protein
MQIQELHLPSWAAEIATVLNGYCKGMGQNDYITPQKNAYLLSMFYFDPFWDSFATKVLTHTLTW